MKTFNSGSSIFPDSKKRWFLWSFLITFSLICGAYLVSIAFIAKEYKQRMRLARWGVIETLQDMKSNACKIQCRPTGSEALPDGIVAKTSDLKMWHLWDSGVNNRISKHRLNLLAIPVGVKQKEFVNKIVKKFPSSEFVVMLFHYDGFVDEWKNFDWNDQAIHVCTINQTKWWFAKRFLHPDVVAEYNYIFLWDEDLGVENFDPKRYLSIVEGEGFEISQPALDPGKSEVHQKMTARQVGLKVHRRYYSLKGRGRCDDHSTSPPCVGWVEMMAPVFSKKSWRCVWHMIQNDLVHAWGLDRQLGYCAQGDRIRKVGVVDSECIVHLGLPTLGGSNSNGNNEPSESHRGSDSARDRAKVRAQSFIEMQVFHKRWKDAARKDGCWIDPYQRHANRNHDNKYWSNL